MENNINWNEIKSLYVSSDRYTLKQLAEKYHVSIATIKRHSSREKWGEQRQKNIQRTAESIEKAQAEIEHTEEIEDFTYRERINEIANRLLVNISAAADAYGKPGNIRDLTAALKDLVTVLRDVNAQPNLTAQRTYELAKQRIALEQKRAQYGSSENDESGVVMLPEVTGSQSEQLEMRSEE